jgi:DNA-binding transcriptional LysR family regulator
MIQNLAYELSVLAKAVQHKNLSAAAVHVGLSQPQISRLIAKIESELNVILLDRSARRKSGWTPIANELALIFSKGMTRLQSDILTLATAREITQLHIGTLEGLSHIAMQFAKQCFENLGMKSVYLDVLDFAELDSNFISGNLDLIFTVKSPGRQKYQHVIEVGFQQMDKVSSDPSVLVMSPFELSGYDKKDLESAKHMFVSNSLSLRDKWLHEFGGTGALPVDAKKGKGKGHHVIYLVGADLISPTLWGKIQNLFV